MSIIAIRDESTVPSPFAPTPARQYAMYRLRRPSTQAAERPHCAAIATIALHEALHEESHPSPTHQPSSAPPPTRDITRASIPKVYSIDRVPPFYLPRASRRRASTKKKHL